ncbi:hypothetical protein BGU32_18435 [Clostridioides difficile]|nr:hypothetical protein BGU32_18435 [Clostridioides difficile]
MIMGDHDDGLTKIVDAVTQEGEQIAAGLRIEGAGRLVGDDDVGAGHQGAGDGDALLLSARHLRRLMAKTLGNAEHSGDVVKPFLVDLGVRQTQRQGDVVSSAESGHEVERLKHEPDVLAT